MGELFFIEENIVEEGKIFKYQHFPPFQRRFQTSFF